MDLVSDGGRSGKFSANRTVPVIDLANENESELVRQIYLACSTWGFFQLVNHGIPISLLNAFQNAMSDFFSLPYETKLKLKRHANNSRGYFDDELTKRRRDWKEALDVGAPGSRDWGLHDFDEDNACLDGYNQFPKEEDCPNFRGVVVEYFKECEGVSDKVARLMALALGVKPDSGGLSNEMQLLDNMLEDHTSYLRMNHYPPCEADKGAGPSSTGQGHLEPPPLGISPHRDAGFLTLLLQDYDCHSLQVARFEDEDNRDDDADWVTVHPLPGSLTVNTGDMAMIWSNGLFRAPLHRVLTDPSMQRYSAPFFYNPGYNEFIAPLRCLSSMTSCGNRAAHDIADKREFGSEIVNNKSESVKHQRKSIQYQPCLWGYFRALRFAGDLTDLGVEIQTSHFKADSTSHHLKTQSQFKEKVNFHEPFDVERYRYILGCED